MNSVGQGSGLCYADDNELDLTNLRQTATMTQNYP